MRDHYFHPEVAADYNVAMAILLNHFYLATTFYANGRRALNKKEYIYEGRPYVPVTYESLVYMHPYYTYDQIRRTIQKLKAEELILVEKFAKSGSNHTQFYALTDKALEYWGISPEIVVSDELSDMAKKPDRSGTNARSKKWQNCQIKEVAKLPDQRSGKIASSTYKVNITNNITSDITKDSFSLFCFSLSENLKTAGKDPLYFERKIDKVKAEEIRSKKNSVGELLDRKFEEGLLTREDFWLDEYLEIGLELDVERHRTYMEIKKAHETFFRSRHGIVPKFNLRSARAIVGIMEYVEKMGEDVVTILDAMFTGWERLGKFEQGWDKLTAIENNFDKLVIEFKSALKTPDQEFKDLFEEYKQMM